MSHFLKKFLLIIVLLSLSNFDCQESKENGENMLFKKDTSYVVIGQGDSGWQPGDNIYEPQLLIFTSLKTWEEKKGLFYLYKNSVDSTGIIKLNSINFEKESILIFTLGIVGSTGYSINVKKLSIGNTVECKLISTRPGPFDATGEAMQHPFVMVIVDTPIIPNEYKLDLDNKKTDFIVHRF